MVIDGTNTNNILTIVSGSNIKHIKDLVVVVSADLHI